MTPKSPKERNQAFREDLGFSVWSAAKRMPNPSLSFLK